MVDFARGGAFARGALICALTAVLVAAAGGGDAFWLCLPLILLVAGPAARHGHAIAGAAAVTAAATVPALASPALGPVPNPALAVAVIAASVAITRALGARLEKEREAMRDWALTDPLTRVFNRRGLAQRIDYEVARHSRQERRFAVVMIDLDGFKLVNDRFGHHAGDDLLKDVADALGDAVRDQDTVARLGGDEFCVLAPETDHDGALHLADRISASIRSVTTGLDRLSASVGVAVFPDDGADPLAVLEAADTAQVAAKRRSPGHRARAA
jgi:diguanylate cyclase (GGDEF)-like protein